MYVKKQKQLPKLQPDELRNHKPQMSPEEWGKLPTFLHQLTTELKDEVIVEPYPEELAARLVVKRNKLNRVISKATAVDVTADAKNRKMKVPARLIQISKRKDLVHLIVTVTKYHFRWHDKREELLDLVEKFLHRGHWITVLHDRARLDFYNGIKRCWDQEELTHSTANLGNTGLKAEVEPHTMSHLQGTLSYWPNHNQQRNQIETLGRVLMQPWLSEIKADEKYMEELHNLCSTVNYFAEELELDDPHAFDLAHETPRMASMLYKYHELQEGYTRCPKCEHVQKLLTFESLVRLYDLETNLCDICDTDLGLGTQDEYNKFLGAGRDAQKNLVFYSN